MAAEKDKLNPVVLNKLYWNRHMPLSEIGLIYNIGPSAILRRMKKYGIARRSLSDSAYIAYSNKPRFSEKINLTAKEELLKIAGLMLYWAEGSFKGKTVDFANSDPDMIRLFLKFLREICQVAEERLRVYIYAFSDQNIEKIRNFWYTVTNIHPSQFTKPYVRKSTSPRDRRMPYGLVKIRYSDKKLLALLTSWLHSFKLNILDRNGQVAERSMAADCVNAASYRKIG